MRATLFLAPMDGLTHVAFRRLVAHYGPPDFFYTEMVSARAIVHQPPERDPYLFYTEADRPLIAQLAGREPEVIVQALERLEARFDFYGYDLNFGCARGRAKRYGWGAALLSEPELARKIAAGGRKMTRKPLFAKLRSTPGHDLRRLIAFAEGLLAEGVEILILHPRAPEDGFRRPPRWEEIAALKRETGATVIGNGDIFSPEDVLRMLETTGCDGVMIGRTALLRPWIFRDARAFLKGDPIPEAPNPFEPVLLMAEHLKLLPEEWREKRFNLWLFWYLQNFPFGLYYFGRVQKALGISEKLAVLKDLLYREKIPPYPARIRQNR
ncbi:tRNA dihydrouridine synthase [Thermosulfurimonas dismutans]|uniref:tRNA-dihydrouridine synthase n=1 Tax=Thermosulfurimonas dismutans TaxID=999894 RepID=A0A179D2Y7_9BACT|nr:tRNA-dihydrouridine synthase family protein [Thermosulfurimonas dismutans]OAQ20161.1 tRNA dihydrouridine synthase B [Thermosulfurimonas dismutans]